ncbi:uncharacterized protein EI90DRAFT_895274 [Cantharellus anzutake]|uniref:uncharacterized protein n=1 Tax=Cantharellus anzutake TaxID=1750568 RepID=UPI001905EBCC|nr:uncharacterized protein EI90DRAFT_895274 [Cantharellus anzutake]KAF8331877.1 hypothetical protein EI90DRAFT_895274 [Cantharellus anzutake]
MTTITDTKIRSITSGTLVISGGPIPRVSSASLMPSPTTTRIEPTEPFRIPYELFRPIIALVDDPKDLRNLAVASRVTQTDAEMFLHRVVTAKGVRELVSRCRWLVRNPRLALLVRQITFRDVGEYGWPDRPLPALYTLIKAAFRNVPRLIHLDASILPSNALPVNAPFTLQSFRHDNLIIGIDALAFLSNQPNVKDLCINPYSYYEMHEDDEHYRRRLYTVLPNLETLACGPSVAIRLVKNRPIQRLIVPARPDYIESDQLERVITALRSSPGCPGCATVRQLVIERRLAGRAGLQCVVKELKDLRALSLVVSYASDVMAP